MIGRFILVAVSALALTACATNQGVQGAAIGAGVGAVAGAVIGNNVGSGNAETGALIGAGVGAATGAVIGCNRPGGCGHNANNPNHSELVWDSYNQRYWYTDHRTGDTYWSNGEPRTRVRR
ncbi:MAG: glycine zipper domain-containing protein [Pseudomonadota bacterium]